MELKSIVASKLVVLWESVGTRLNRGCCIVMVNAPLFVYRGFRRAASHAVQPITACVARVIEDGLWCLRPTRQVTTNH